MASTRTLLIVAVLLFTAITDHQIAHGQTSGTLQVAQSLQMFVDQLPDMPKVYGYSYGAGRSPPQSSSITIGMYQKQWKFHRDLPSTTVFAFGTSADNATVPGPTVEALDGVATSVTWENHLPDKHILPWDPTVPTAIPKNGGVPTVVHLHGGIQEPQSDGSAFAWFTADFKETGPAWTKRTYTYPNQRQLPGNLWYHDHAVGLTRVNLLAGLIGAYVIRDPSQEGPFDLPDDEFDRHLLVFDRSFNADGSLYMNTVGNNPSIHPQWQPEYFGDAIIVNGKAWPYMNVQRRRYRFRIINTSNARYFRLSMNNGLTFKQVASDSTYLRSPVRVSSLLLAPAEVADVVVDFSTSTTNEAILINDAPYPYPTGSPVNTLTGNVMRFVIAPGAPRIPDNSTVPPTMIPYPQPMNLNYTTRYIVMYEYDSADGNPTHLYINGKRLDDPVTEMPKVGSTEIWKVINLTPDNHPLHLHLGLFQAVEQRQLLSVSDFLACMTMKNDALNCNLSKYAQGPLVPLPANEMTWKNVVKMSPGLMTTIVVRFGFVHTNQPYPFDATAEPGYVYHCHILDHEDNAMIRPLKLV